MEREPQAGSGARAAGRQRHSAKAAVGPAGRLPSMLGRPGGCATRPCRPLRGRTVLGQCSPTPRCARGNLSRPARLGAANAPRPLPACGSALRMWPAHAALHASDGSHARLHECTKRTSAAPSESLAVAHWPSAIEPLRTGASAAPIKGACMSTHVGARGTAARHRQCPSCCMPRSGNAREALRPIGVTQRAKPASPCRPKLSAGSPAARPAPPESCRAGWWRRRSPRWSASACR